MRADEKVKSNFTSWYQGLKTMKQYGSRPPKGTVAAALIVLERLRDDCELDIGAHIADGGAQIAGLSLSSLRRILDRFGEAREFPSEGGRTNRGNNKAISLLLEALGQAGFGDLKKQARNLLLDWMQERLVGSLDAYYNLERVRFDFDASRPVRGVVADILERAKQRNQSGPVAQHLVGAKLALRFPHLEVGNFAYSAADDQAGRAGDFQVGGTAFHVTVAPGLGHIARCEGNIRQGLSAFLIVPDSKVINARALLETQELLERVAVESVESFVGQNISELAEFAPANLPQKLGELLKEYNRRVGEVETDFSLMIEIPSALRGDEE
jgi:hypothetical protein